MSIRLIDSQLIYHAFLSGASAVIKERNELNKINVFPVPDGDTGTNLAFTMNAIIEEAQVFESTKQTLESIADAALTGARGNSGIIFAQFINGFYLGLEDKNDISISSFSNSAKEAVDYARNSITNPVEGTMITVMKDWSDSLDALKDITEDFTEILTKSLHVALTSVKSTPEKLKVLRDFSVVDAGAKGFFYFLEGFANFIKSGKVDIYQYNLDSVSINLAENHLHEDVDLTYRFCTEALIKGENLNLDDIKLALSDLGNSLVVAGNKNKVRIHMHTNLPAEMIQRLKLFGQVLQQKADDMVRQYEAGYKRKHKIALVTDSIADLPKEMLDYHQIHMLPLNLLVDDSVYLDKVTIRPSYLYELMDDSTTYPSSSQPTLKAAENFLNGIASNYDSVIVVTVSSKMSGTFNTLNQAASNLSEKGHQISVIDSKLNSGAQGLVVLKAAEEIEAGKHFEEVIQVVEDTIENTTIYVSIDTLKYMVRSGRLKKVQGTAAKLLNLKPVVSIDKEGEGIIIGKVFSKKANMKKILNLVRQQLESKEITSYAIVHADAQEKALDFEKIFTNLIGSKPAYTTDISSIVAMNAGIGCIAISFTTK
ncbi:DAK2 domain-containing protein [Sporosarcina sp. CAU 1771]